MMPVSLDTGPASFLSMITNGELPNATKSLCLSLGLVVTLVQWAYVNSCPPPLLNVNGRLELTVDLRGMLR